jgi:hypothetical protein
MLGPGIGLRLQAVMDMKGNDMLPRVRADRGMQQSRGIEAAAEGDRYDITGSWCR